MPARSTCLRLLPQQARAVAVRAQLLDAAVPTRAVCSDLLATARHLTRLRADLTTYVCPSAEHIAWSRMRSPTAADELERLVEDGALIELRGELIPAGDIALHLDDMAHWPGAEPHDPAQQDLLEWVQTNEECRLDVLAVLRDSGPTAAADLPDTCVRPWRSTGWTDGKNVQRLLGLMQQRGEVALAGREAGAPLWDLAERVYPDVEPVPWREARALRDARRLTALGIARPNRPGTQEQFYRVGDAGVPVTVEGTRGTWHVDQAQLERLDEPVEDRVAVLSPLDTMVMDRQRLQQLFGWEYTLEMYVPQAKRRWGYFALPVLVGTRFVGKLDAAAQPDRGQLHVTRLHADAAVTPAELDGIDHEIRSLATMLGLDVTYAQRWAQSG